MAGMLSLFVIRGVDDEASLTLAAGAIGARLSYLAMTKLTFFVLMVIPIGFGLIAYTLGLIGSAVGLDSAFGLSPATLNGLMYNLIAVGGILCVLGALLANAFKSVFGREFFIGSMRCDVAVNSVPDVINNAVAVTLPSFAPSALETHHYIYEHPSCIPEIVHWIAKRRDQA